MDRPRDRAHLAAELAGAFLAGPATVDELAERAAGVLDGWPAWLELLAMRVAAASTHLTGADRRQRLAELIEAFLYEHAGAEELSSAMGAPAPRPAPAHGWALAAIGSAGELADWLELSTGQLAWMADVRGLERTVASERLRNYRYRTLPRRGGVPRMIEIPKLRLKEIQRRLLAEILSAIPAHPAAHGFTRGRSALTHARLHVSREMVLQLDLQDFFASVPARRVFGIFRAAGYRPDVAHALTGLTTNVVPSAVWQAIPRAQAPPQVGPHFRLGRRLATPHLPQGAPSSPALANLAAFGLDRRLAALAAAAGLGYSRYADDLVLSGPRLTARRRGMLLAAVAQIVREEGFAVHGEKSRLTGRGSRQIVCGIVVNAHTNAAREEYERLKAILHNAARDGPGSQNRAGVPDFEAHLRGRVAWVASLNPGRGARLHRRLEAIDWRP